MYISPEIETLKEGKTKGLQGSFSLCSWGVCKHVNAALRVQLHQINILGKLFNITILACVLSSEFHDGWFAFVKSGKFFFFGVFKINNVQWILSKFNLSHKTSTVVISDWKKGNTH